MRAETHNSPAHRRRNHQLSHAQAAQKRANIARAASGPACRAFARL